jgi:DNA polymerase III sliding clamp (beta) subunit (PCNA family)
LVPVAKGQVAEVYVVLVGQTSTGAMYVEHARNGLRIRYKIEGARIEAATPTVLMCVELSFFSALKKNEDVTFVRDDNATTVSFTQGRSRGSITVTPPNSFMAPVPPAPAQSVTVPVDVVRAGLQATAFSSSDPTLTGTGVLSSVIMREGELSVVTYDSMCGAVYKRSGDELHAEIPEGFTLTLPNNMINTIFSQADVPEIAVSVGLMDMRFRTSKLDVMFPKIDYPLLPVEASIQNCIDTAQHGFNIDTNVFIDAVTTNATYMSVDKDANTLLLEIGQQNMRVSIKSVKITHNCVIPIENFKKAAFQCSCDVSRLQTFLRLVKGVGRLTVLFSNHRLVFKVPGALYAIVES